MKQREGQIKFTKNKSDNERLKEGSKMENMEKNLANDRNKRQPSNSRNR